MVVKIFYQKKTKDPVVIRLKKGHRFLRERKLLKYQFIHVEKANFPIITISCVMNVSRQGYYKWCKTLPSPKIQKNEKLKLKSTSPLGKTMVDVESFKPLKYKGSHATKTTDSKHNRKVFPNLITQDFRAYLPLYGLLILHMCLQKKVGFIYAWF
jgi:hypothetical protein